MNGRRLTGDRRLVRTGGTSLGLAARRHRQRPARCGRQRRSRHPRQHRSARRPTRSRPGGTGTGNPRAGGAGNAVSDSVPRAERPPRDHRDLPRTATMARETVTWRVAEQTLDTIWLAGVFGGRRTQAQSVNGRGGGGAWRPRAHRRRTRQAPELAGVARGLGAWSAWSGARAATPGRGLCAHPRRWTGRRGRRPRGSDVRAPARVPRCARPERPAPAGARSHCRSREPHFTYRHTRPQPARGIPTCPRRAVTRRRFQRAVGATPYGGSCDRGGGLGHCACSAARELGDRLHEEAQRGQSNEDLVRRFVEACRRT